MRDWTRAAAIAAIIGGLAVSASAQDLTYVANPPRTFVRSPGVTPLGIPKCATDDPTLPTAGIIYCYTPTFIWSAYNVLPVLLGGNLGQGQTIVIVDAFGSPTAAADLLTFHNTFFGGLPAPDFEVVCPMGCPPFNPRNAPNDQVGWSFETTLDVQWAHAIAPLAKIKLVVAPNPHGNSINNAVAYAVSHYPGSIISQSFGTPEAGIHGNAGQWQQGHQNYVKAVQQRITVLASTGDLGATNGAFPEANAGFPASDPNVTAIGGTQGLPLGNLVLLSGSCTPPAPTSCTPIGYGAEQAWNEAWIQAAGGGALSSLFGTPDYQAGLGLNSRAIPDVSYNAAVDGGVLIAYSALGPDAAGFYVIGGTSAGTPQWAGIFALTNTARAASAKAPIGFANPALYAIAKGPNHAASLHDITAGDNILDGTTIGFPATAGYDLATGWGTPNVANLVPALAAQP